MCRIESLADFLNGHATSLPMDNLALSEDILHWCRIGFFAGLLLPTGGRLFDQKFWLCIIEMSSRKAVRPRSQRAKAENRSRDEHQIAGLNSLKYARGKVFGYADAPVGCRTPAHIAAVDRHPVGRKPQGIRHLGII